MNFKSRIENLTCDINSSSLYLPTREDIQSLDESIQKVTCLAELLDYESLCHVMLKLRKSIMSGDDDLAFASVSFLKNLAELHSKSTYDSEYEKECFQKSFNHIIPTLIPSMVNSAIREEIVAFFRVYIEATKNPDSLISVLISDGLEDVDWRIRKEALALIRDILEDQPVLLIPSLLSSLIIALKDSSNAVVEQTISIFRMLTKTIGFDKLKTKVNDQDTNLIPIFLMHEKIILDGYLKNSDDTSDTLHFNVIPDHLVHELQNGNWKARCNSIEIIYGLITEKYALLQDKSQELVDFLIPFCQDENFKIALTSLSCLEKIMDQLQVGQVSDYICKKLVQVLIGKCFENKIIIRQKATNLLILLIQKLKNPFRILKMSLNEANNYGSRVKAEFYDLITTFLLLFPKEKIDIEFILRKLIKGLQDTKIKVKYHSMEACATLAKIIKPAELLSLLSKLGLDGDDFEIIKTRLKDERLPFLSIGNRLEHIYSPITYSSIISPLNNCKEQEENSGHYLQTESGFDDQGRQSLESIDSHEAKIDELFSKINMISNSVLSNKGADGDAENLVMKPTLKSMSEVALQPIKENSRRAVRYKSEPVLDEIEKQNSLTGKEHKEREKRLKNILQQLKNTEDWEVPGIGLNELLKSDTEDLAYVAKNIPELTLALGDQVQNLRSSISKIAIKCVGRLFEAIPKQIETHLDVLVLGLLRKIGESNNFILEEVDESLEKMVNHMNELKTISAILNSAQHKNQMIRMKVAVLIKQVVSRMPLTAIERLWKNQKESEKILNTLVSFLSEGNSETRNAAKDTFVLLSQSENFDAKLSKTVNLVTLKEVKDILKAHLKKINGGQRITKRSLSSIQDNNDINEPRLDDINMLIASEDWKTRLEALSMLQQHIQKNRNALNKHIMRTIFDNYSQRLNDGNSKVALQAILVLNHIITQIGSDVEPVLPMIIPILATQLISSNSQIRTAANESIDSIILNGSNTSFQILASIVQFGGNNKVRVFVVEKLQEIVARNIKSHQSAIIKYVIPSSLKLFLQDKPEIRKANKLLLTALNSTLGQEFATSVEKSALTPDMKKRILNNAN